MHNKNKKYHDFVEDNIFLKQRVLYEYCWTIFLFFSTLKKTNKEFMHLYKKLRNLFTMDKESLEEFKKEWLFYLYLRYFVKKYFLIKILIKF